jgi:hypothetical protein
MVEPVGAAPESDGRNRQAHPQQSFAPSSHEFLLSVSVRHQDEWSDPWRRPAFGIRRRKKSRALYQNVGESAK